MNLDQLIEHLEGIRKRHGGSHPVVLGQLHPENPKWMSHHEISKDTIRENITEVSFTSVPGYGYQSGWVVFEIPAEGIKHRPMIRLYAR